MRTAKSFEQWRAEEFAKLNLLKSKYKLHIEVFTNPMFSFVVTEMANNMQFGVVVFRKDGFEESWRKYIQSVENFQNIGGMHIPVLLMRIDEQAETGEVDYFSIRSYGGIQFKKNIDSFHFRSLSPKNLDEMVKQYQLTMMRRADFKVIKGSGT